MISTDDTINKTTRIGAKLPSRDGLLITVHERNQKLQELTDESKENSKLIDAKNETINSQKNRINALEEYIRILKQKRFGASSEKSLLQGEFDLGDEAELLADGESDALGEYEEQDKLDNDQPKKSGRKGGKGLSPDLPRVRIEHCLSDEERANAIDTFFEHVKDELDIIPTKAQVLEHWQEKAVFKDENGKRSLVAAKRPPHPLGKSIASVSLLSYIAISKYSDGLPLYRLENILARYGGEITRTSMANWIIRLAEQFQPVLNLLEDTLLDCNYVQGDETRIQVLKEAGTEPTSYKYMWVMRGGPPDKPVVTFNYDKSRGAAVAMRLLDGYEGQYFQSDGYAGYDSVCVSKNITHLGCWDHARRKFVEAIRGMPKAKKGASVSKAQIALSKINALYAIERQATDKGLDADERYEYRQAHAIEKLESLKAWLEKTAPKIDKDSKSYKACAYTLNQW